MSELTAETYSVCTVDVVGRAKDTTSGTLQHDVGEV